MIPEVKPALLKPDNFSSFGDVIQTEAMPAFAINEGTTLRFNDLAEIDISDDDGKAIVSIFRGQPRKFPFEIRMLERHPLGSQAFIPLSGLSYFVVVADQADSDRPGRIQCFLATKFQGVNYRKGIWHHPRIAIGGISDFLVIDRSGPGENLEEVKLTLDKRLVLTDPESFS